MTENEEIKNVIDELADMLDKRSFLLGSIMGSLSGLIKNIETQLLFTTESINPRAIYNDLKTIHQDYLQKINELFYEVKSR